MKKIKAEVHKWNDGKLWSVHATVRTGHLETGNHKSKPAAKRAFSSICNVLGIDREKWEFVDNNK